MLNQKLVNFKYHFTALAIMAFVFVIVATFVINGVIAATSTSSSGPDESVILELNKQIEAQRAKVDKLTEDIEKYKTGINQTRSQAATLQNQVLIINNQIAKADLDIQAKEEEIKTIELEIQKIELEIKNNQDGIERDKVQLSAFIRQLDYYDKKSYLTVLLSNNSFSEFFDQIKNLEGVSEDLQNTLNRVQELTTKLETQKQEMDSKRKTLGELVNKLEDEKASLDDQKGEKQYLVVQTKNSERKYQNLIADLKQAQAAANSQAAYLEKKLRAELEKKGSGEKFNSLGDAVLSWPTTVRRITATFHDPDYPFINTVGQHSGLDIGVKSGTPIMAAEAGYVAKAATGTKWYGNYIMIIHSNNLSTLYGHLTSLNVSNDQYVSKGQIIGYSGSTGFSSGPHLHFEVRSNGVPVNPQSYLP